MPGILPCGSWVENIRCCTKRGRNTLCDGLWVPLSWHSWSRRLDNDERNDDRVGGSSSIDRMDLLIDVC